MQPGPARASPAGRAGPGPAIRAAAPGSPAESRMLLDLTSTSDHPSRAFGTVQSPWLRGPGLPGACSRLTRRPGTPWRARVSPSRIAASGCPAVHWPRQQSANWVAAGWLWSDQPYRSWSNKRGGESGTETHRQGNKPAAAESSVAVMAARRHRAARAGAATLSQFTHLPPCNGGACPARSP